jgi:hypothetical protein
MLRALAPAGAINLQYGSLHISHSLVHVNTAHRNGGAILARTHEEYPDASSTLWLLNVSIDYIVAEASGGMRGWHLSIHHVRERAASSQCQLDSDSYLILYNLT